MSVFRLYGVAFRLRRRELDGGGDLRLTMGWGLVQDGPARTASITFYATDGETRKEINHQDSSVTGQVAQTGTHGGIDLAEWGDYQMKDMFGQGTPIQIEADLSVTHNGETRTATVFIDRVKNTGDDSTVRLSGPQPMTRLDEPQNTSDPSEDDRDGVMQMGSTRLMLGAVVIIVLAWMFGGEN